MLAAVRLTPLSPATLSRASRIDPAEVRALDSIHLEAAVRLFSDGTVDAVLTHDKQLRRGCQHHGIPLAS